MNYRIGEGKKWLMLIVAIIIDIIEIVASPTVVVAIFSGIFQYALMWGMFATSGVKFFGGAKRIRRQITSGVLESIPVVEMLPIYTWSVWKTIEESRQEDRENAAADSTNTLNQNIIRQKNQISDQSQNSNVIRQKKS